MMIPDILEAERVRSIVGGFFDAYNYFGPGLSEGIYSSGLEVELTDRGHHVARELSVPVYYKGRYVGRQRLDMVVDSAVIVEIKAGGDRVRPGTSAQVITYLKVSSFHVALLLHLATARFSRFIDYPKRHAQHIRGNSCHSCPEKREPDAPTGA